MTAFQGFDRKLNLRENTDDRDVLNNLGVAPIADDIALFVNNLRNTSELLVTQDKVQGNTIRFNPLSQRFIFTNGTKLRVFDGDTVVGNYYVGNSNNANEFQIYSDANLTQVVTPIGGISVRYVRSDAVLQGDVLNLVTPRRPVVELQSFSQITPPTTAVDVPLDTAGITSTVSTNIYTSLRRVFSSYYGGLDNLSISTITAYMNAIESDIDTFEQKKQKSIINSKDFITEKKITFNGNFVVATSPEQIADGINVNSVSLNSGPGIFILDTTTDIPKRAFSDNENVWTADPPAPAIPTDLVCATREIVIGSLVFFNGVRIIRRTGFPEIITESGPAPTNLANTFTHYVKVTVNGEEYSLCLK